MMHSIMYALFAAAAMHVAMAMGAQGCQSVGRGLRGEHVEVLPAFYSMRLRSTRRRAVG